MTSREAFIYLCLTIANIDEDLDPREEAQLKKIFDEHGFSQNEIRTSQQKFNNIDIKEAFEHGVMALQIACDLDAPMREKLLNCMVAVAEADGVVDPREHKLIKCTEHMFQLAHGKK